MIDVACQVLLNKEMIDVNQDYPGKANVLCRSMTLWYIIILNRQRRKQDWLLELHRGSHKLPDLGKATT